MRDNRLVRSVIIGSLVILGSGLAISAQTLREGEKFGPVVTSYLGYLRNEQEVVDDRISKREVTVEYYRRNSNRIRALRQMAIRIARSTGNDYLPEMEAVAGDEVRSLFEHPPRFDSLKPGDIIQTTFRYLGDIHSGDVFYVFARLDPYEQAELLQKAKQTPDSAAGSAVSSPVTGAKVTTRARRVATP